MPVVAPIAGLTPESVTRFLVGGFMEVLRSWMEDPDSTDLSGRVQRGARHRQRATRHSPHIERSQHG